MDDNCGEWVESTQTWRYNYINKNIRRLPSSEISTCEVASDILQKFRADFVYDNGILEVSLLHV